MSWRRSLPRAFQVSAAVGFDGRGWCWVGGFATVVAFPVTVFFLFPPLSVDSTYCNTSLCVLSMISLRVLCAGGYCVVSHFGFGVKKALC